MHNLFRRKKKGESVSSSIVGITGGDGQVSASLPSSTSQWQRGTPGAVPDVYEQPRQQQGQTSQSANANFTIGDINEDDGEDQFDDDEDDSDLFEFTRPQTANLAQTLTQTGQTGSPTAKEPSVNGLPDATGGDHHAIKYKYHLPTARQALHTPSEQASEVLNKRHSPTHSTTTPPSTTEAQRIARQYQQQQDADGSSGAADSDGRNMRRLAYAYPSSPMHSGDPQSAISAYSARRTSTPVIELAGEDSVRAISMRSMSRSRNRNDSEGMPPSYCTDDQHGDASLRTMSTRRKQRRSPPIARDGGHSDHAYFSEKSMHGRSGSPKDEKYFTDMRYTKGVRSNTYEMSNFVIESTPATMESGFVASGYSADSTLNRHTHDSLGDLGGAKMGGMGDDKLTLSAFQLDEEDSPYPEVAASVSNYDDPMMPCLTFRAVFLGCFFTAAGSAFNFFFLVRQPSPMFTPITVQVLSYPAGKLMDRILPATDYKYPKFLQRIGFPSTFSLNPGPFNVKEHAVITIMANVAISPSFALNTTIVLDRFYNIPKGMGFDALLTISTSFIGFSFAGICRRFLVWPASLIWPQNLVTCTLFNTFHAEEDDPLNGVTRFKMFFFVASGAFLWYFMPGFIFQGLSFFSFVCWIWPRNRVVNQLFGVATGLGMSGISFDWTQIAYVVSPLFVPWFAIVNITAGFVIIYWVLVPIFYYTNTWNFAYLPISSQGNFDRYGMPYNVTQVITPDIKIDEDAFRAYSPLFVTTTYAVVYALSFCLSSSAVVHTILYHGKEIWGKFRSSKSEEEDVHAKLMRNYPEVPDWWYALVFLTFTGLAVVAVEVFHTGLPVWGLLLAILLPAIYVLPGGYVYSITAQLITVNLLAELVPGYLLPNQAIPNMIFKTFSIQCLQSALYFIQDLKLGHYMKIPPRITFHVQILATFLSAFAQVAVKRSLEVFVADLCTPDQPARMNCAPANVQFQASLIWGVIGPARFFGGDTPYRALLYFLLLGLLLPIPFYLASKKWPNSWMRYINIPVLINGVTFIPPATGLNYSSWFIAGAIFQYYLRRHRFRWWSRFNFVTSAGLDAGTVLSTVFIFFALQLPKSGRISIKWWGNAVFTETFDWLGMPYLDAPSEGFGPTSWS